MSVVSSAKILKLTALVRQFSNSFSKKEQRHLMELSTDLTEVYVTTDFLLSSESKFVRLQVIEAAQLFPQSSPVQSIFYV